VYGFSRELGTSHSAKEPFLKSLFQCPGAVYGFSRELGTSHSAREPFFNSDCKCTKICSFLNGTKNIFTQRNFFSKLTDLY